MNDAKRNSVIQIARIIAMISIILCHIIKYYTFIPGSQFLNVVFNVGVQIFLLISGFLYGQKKINDFHLFFVRRIQKSIFACNCCSYSSDNYLSFVKI